MIKLINDEKIKKVYLRESREPFVDLRGVHPKIIVDNSRLQIASNSKYFCYCRRTAAELLVEATMYLPEGLSLYIKEAYRSLSRQKISIDNVYNHYSKKFPELNNKQLMEKVYEYVAPVDVAPHPTGAAIDLTLIDQEGNELNMGTDFNAVPVEVDNKTYTYSELLNGEERFNRSILVQAMERAGFVNYPTEWWHWSYGDKYWGYYKNMDAIYGPVKEEDMAVEKENEGYPVNLHKA
jgi:zinc D-Ala-D-Ala dipeptidase